MRKVKGNEIIQVALAAVLSIGLCSAAFVGVNNWAFAAATSKTESIPANEATVNIPLAETVSAENYQKPELDVYEAQNEWYSASADALSYEEAAQLGALYIWDMFGESIDGKAVEMLYTAQPYFTRAYWHGAVADTRADLENHDTLFTFTICAVSGERIDISKFSLGFTEESSSEVKEVLSALMNDSSRRDEAARVRLGGELPAPAQLDEYAQVAEDFAAKQFCGTEIIRIEFRNAAVAEYGFDENGNIVMTGQRLLFAVMDSTLREAYVTINTETKELLSIETQHNDVVPGYK